MGLSILSTNFSAFMAAEFLDSIAAGLHSIYLTVGRSDNFPWPVEDDPPGPRDSIMDESEFRSNIIGIKRIDREAMVPLIKDVRWAPDVKFNPWDPEILYPKRQLDYYVVTSENKVFLCTYAPDTNTTVGSEPSLMDANVVTPDAYEWKYLYTVPVISLNAGLIVEGWQPVAYNLHGEYPGGNLVADQNSFGDNNANYTLGAWRCLVMGRLEDEGAAIPYYISYRQIGLIIDPRDSTGALLGGTNYGAAEFDIDSGVLVYLENRAPVYRAPDQQEEIRLIISL